MEAEDEAVQKEGRSQPTTSKVKKKKKATYTYWAGGVDLMITDQDYNQLSDRGFIGW